METELKEYTVKELCEGFTYSKVDGKGLYGLGGKLTIQSINVTISIVRIIARKKPQS